MQKNTRKNVKYSRKSMQIPVERADTAQKSSEIKTLCSEPLLLSISEIAARTKINRNTVARKLQYFEIEPVLSTPNKKLFEYTDELEDALFSKDEDPRVLAAQLANLKLKNQIKQIDLEIARGERLHINEFTEITQKIFGTLIKRLQRTPDRIALGLHHLSSKKDVERVLRKEITKLFKQTREEHAQYLEPDKTNEQGKTKTVKN